MKHNITMLTYILNVIFCTAETIAKQVNDVLMLMLENIIQTTVT